MRYAMVNYCDAGDGYGWGSVKPTKCETDPDRIDVKRTYLRDYSQALKREEAGTHILVYFDESYIHQKIRYTLVEWSQIPTQERPFCRPSASGDKKNSPLTATSANGNTILFPMMATAR